MPAWHDASLLHRASRKEGPQHQHQHQAQLSRSHKSRKGQFNGNEGQLGGLSFEGCSIVPDTADRKPPSQI
jgi:hypothetical protein